MMLQKKQFVARTPILLRGIVHQEVGISKELPLVSNISHFQKSVSQPHPVLSTQRMLTVPVLVSYFTIVCYPIIPGDPSSEDFQNRSSKLDSQICEEASSIGSEEKVCCKNNEDIQVRHCNSNLTSYHSKKF